MFNLSLTQAQVFLLLKHLFMRKLFFILLAFVFGTTVFAQTSTKNSNPIGARAADHFMLQIGSSFWTGAPDSVNAGIKGLNRSANIYFMYDKQFKSNPKLSVAFGIGIGNNNMYFNKLEPQITANSSKLPFIRTDTGNNYKKYKIATSYLEIPLELRFMSNPENPNKSIKAALGVKVGTIINAHTRAKNLQNSAGARLNNFAYKETTKGYFNGTRLSLTGRVGYGIFSLYGSYALTNVFKDGVTADIKSYQIGLSISGL
jgi:Outer membrane protein beta-barrel domain